MIEKPQSDFCWTCRQNSKAILQTSKNNVQSMLIYRVDQALSVHGLYRGIHCLLVLLLCKQAIDTAK